MKINFLAEKSCSWKWTLKYISWLIDNLSYPKLWYFMLFFLM